MTKDDMKNIIMYKNIDDIALCYAAPKYIKGIALWIPYLGGNKNTGNSEIIRLYENGLLAISFDPWMHGDRYKGIKPSIRTRALKEYKAVMWTILGNSTLSAMRIIDWAFATFGKHENVVAGGLSMGGDVALALAGIDQRIIKVAGIASSPDWNRKGMADVMDSSKIIDQGQPTSYSAWLYGQMNPMNHIKNYYRDIHIVLEYSKKDRHIHAEWGNEFKQEVEKKKSKSKIDVIVDEEVSHISIIQKKSVIERSISFLSEESET